MGEEIRGGKGQKREWEKREKGTFNLTPVPVQQVTCEKITHYSLGSMTEEVMKMIETSKRW